MTRMAWAKEDSLSEVHVAQRHRGAWGLPCKRRIWWVRDDNEAVIGEIRCRACRKAVGDVLGPMTLTWVSPAGITHVVERVARVHVENGVTRLLEGGYLASPCGNRVDKWDGPVVVDGVVDCLACLA